MSSNITYDATSNERKMRCRNFVCDAYDFFVPQATIVSLFPFKDSIVCVLLFFLLLFYITHQKFYYLHELGLMEVGCRFVRGGEAEIVTHPLASMPQRSLKLRFKIAKRDKEPQLPLKWAKLYCVASYCAIIERQCKPSIPSVRENLLCDDDAAQQIQFPRRNKSKNIARRTDFSYQRTSSFPLHIFASFNNLCTL